MVEALEHFLVARHLALHVHLPEGIDFSSWCVVKDGMDGSWYSTLNIDDDRIVGWIMKMEKFGLNDFQWLVGVKVLS